MRKASLVAGLLLACAAAAGHAAALELSEAEQAGRRLFREGVGGDGKPVMARVGLAGATVSAAVTPCANCHGSDARGRPEGAIRPPDINWRELAKAYGRVRANGTLRPAYDAGSFYAALVQGVDASGAPLDPAMPRFALTRADADNLRAYLARVADDRDPGLSAERIRIGTLLPRQGPFAGYARAVEHVLRQAFAEANAGSGIYGRQLELVVIDAEVDAGPAALRAQAREALATSDVFAWLSPLLPGIDKEIGPLAEAAEVPVVGALATGGRYNFRALPTTHEQAQALGEFARREFAPAARPGSAPLPVVVAHDDDATSRALAVALEEQLSVGGWAEVMYYDGTRLPAGLVAWRDTPARLLFYFGREAELGSAIAALKGNGASPTVLALGQLGRAASQLPAAQVAGRYLALPWTPAALAEAAQAKLAQLRAAPEARGATLTALVDAELNAQVLIEGLKRAGRAPSRAKLVDAMENLFAFDTGLAPPISFGPGRRVGVRGAHVVALDAEGMPTSPRFVAVEGRAP